MEQTKRILIVEDEVKIAHLLQDYLQNSGFVTECLHDGAVVLPAVRRQPPDLLLLDLMLPGKDGLSICQELRQFSRLPVIMITARVEEIDRVLGLEIGANDYICKPFSPREVVARVKALFRTLALTQAPPSPNRETIRLDESRMVVVLAGVDMPLTPVEFRLLNSMAAQPGRIFSRSQLMAQAYADQRVVTDRTVDSHIKNLRKKIAQYYPSQELIKSVYGVGYKFELDENIED